MSTEYIAAVARPGDIVLIGFNRLLDEDEFEQFQQSFAELAASGIRFGIVEDVAAMVVVQPAPPEGDS